MTVPMSRIEAALARLGKHDPFSTALWAGPPLPTPKAVRIRFVVELVAHLHDSLTDSLVTEPEAYQTFVRAVSMLNTFLPEGSRR
ncbi:hypothetical protein OHA72_03555 [Dactylosporangium sp. NBC_01737]|uniref:hypothetical protein n=1 Tax=Dactylosporangium sp. NBC_01737 TaxID=2975959 RepID=UPI002E117379|nr:hypothetical protein OHA72_03555 [Dactylosporangium sp. NBC_01737]